MKIDSNPFFPRTIHMAKNGEKYSKEQSEYLSKMTSVSDGNLLSLCNNSAKLSCELNKNCEFLIAIRQHWFDFVANKMIDNNVKYDFWQDAWTTFERELNDSTRKFSLIKHEFKDGSSKGFQTLTSVCNKTGEVVENIQVFLEFKSDENQRKVIHESFADALKKNPNFVDVK